MIQRDAFTLSREPGLIHLHEGKIERVMGQHAALVLAGKHRDRAGRQSVYRQDGELFCFSEQEFPAEGKHSIRPGSFWTNQVDLYANMNDSFGSLRRVRFGSAQRFYHQASMTPAISLAVFQGRVGDRNPRAMAGANVVGAALAARLNVSLARFGEMASPLQLPWDRELAAALPVLREIAKECASLLAAQRVPLLAMGRCAASLATLPCVAQRCPDACVVWFDAHADSNLPSSRAVPYLGGMVLSGAAGLWNTGLGAGLQLSNVVLLGSREIDPDEQALIDSGALKHVPVGANLPERLRDAIGDRPIYVHLDCDVLDPGIVPTEYRSPNGLTLQDLRAVSEVLSKREIIGLEIAEFEATWPETRAAGSPNQLLDALQPLLDSMAGS